MYLEAAHFSFHAEPKPVQLAHYQSKIEKFKKKHCLNKVATSNVTKSSNCKIPQAKN